MRLFPGSVTQRPDPPRQRRQRMQASAVEEDPHTVFASNSIMCRSNSSVARTLASVPMDAMICCPMSGGTSPAATAPSTCSICRAMGCEASKLNFTISDWARRVGVIRFNTRPAARMSPASAASSTTRADFYAFLTQRLCHLAPLVHDPFGSACWVWGRTAGPPRRVAGGRRKFPFEVRHFPYCMIDRVP